MPSLSYRISFLFIACLLPTLNIWALNFKREWKPYTYFMPFGTDLAMSAVIAY